MDTVADICSGSESLGARPAKAGGNCPEVSVVIPCLNEERTLGTCIDKALAAFEAAGIAGEVVVADNGSSDSSVDVAERHGARVLHASVNRYGCKYLANSARVDIRFHLSRPVHIRS